MSRVLPKRIGFITCESLARFFPSHKEPYFTQDDQVLVDHFRSQSIEVIPIFWGCGLEVIPPCDAWIMRSAWDYMNSLESISKFIAWLESLEKLSFPILNSPKIMKWNLDKHYLRELQSKNVNTIPTQFLHREEKIDLLEWLRKWKSIVVKPTISGAAVNTFALHSMSDIEQFKHTFDPLRAHRDFMLQPYLPAFVEKGEWSIVFFGDQYSHAVLKRPAPGHWLVQDELGGTVESKNPPPPLLDFAAKVAGTVISILKETPLYQRIDLVEVEGEYLVGEVELIEPELFFLTRAPSKNLPNTKAISLFWEALELRIR